MDVDAEFFPGSKRVLVALLTATKDFNRANSLPLRFTPAATVPSPSSVGDGGLTARFACGPPLDPRACVVSLSLPHAVPAFAAAENSAAATATAVGATSVPSPASTTLPASSATSPSSAVSPTSPLGAAPAAISSASTASSPPVSDPSPTASSTASPPPALPSVAAFHPPRASAFSRLQVRAECVVSVQPATFARQLELVDELDRITVRAERAAGGVPIYELYCESPGRKVLYEMDAAPRTDPVALPVTPPVYNLVVQIEASEFQRTVAALQDTSDKGPPRFRVLSYTAPVRLVLDTRYLRGFTLATGLGTFVTLSLHSPAHYAKVSYTAEVDASFGGSAPEQGLPSPTASVQDRGGRSELVTPVSDAASRPSSPATAAPRDVFGGRKSVGTLDYYLMPLPADS
ncbi:hypothetical protein HK405_008331 [Cladochytrium tenue]|nr:hypothetical protein HK405_008331 [Cladochytrium tenue]